MNRYLIIFFTIALPAIASAQTTSLTFPSTQIQNIAKELTGAETNWPLIFSLAEKDKSSNKFSLSPENILKLKNFSRATEKVSESKQRINELISEGASIFAVDELHNTNALIDKYSSHIQNGEIEAAFDTATQLSNSISKLDSVLTLNRIVDIEAQLVTKEGDVDKKEGILGKWTEAFEGDLFEESDGIKTYEESYANMTFVDGSTVVINPQTEAIIRKSTIDRLYESADTEITLVEGALLSRLSGNGKEKGNFILYAGSSETDLNTLNFLAETNAESTVKLTNYDGQALVKANDLTITIRKNEGTIVEEGKDPLPPVKLLPPPTLEKFITDAVIYEDKYMFAFQPVDGAVEYHIQVGNTPGFDNDVRDFYTTETSIVIRSLDMGSNYLHVQAVDELGLKGPFSRKIRLIRNEDNQPPPLYLTGTQNGILFIRSNTATIVGTSEIGAQIKIEDEIIQTEANGSFRHSIDLNKNEKRIIVAALDDSGNETTREIRLIRPLEEKLFDLTIQGGSFRDQISLRTNPVTISGTAYPELHVVIMNGDQTEILKTDSKGRWGIKATLSGPDLTIQFLNSADGTEYASRTFKIQKN